MVRLKLPEDFQVIELETETSQFHYGSIKTALSDGTKIAEM